MKSKLMISPSDTIGFFCLMVLFQCGQDELEPLKDENEELEAIADDIEGVDELESIANS